MPQDLRLAFDRSVRSLDADGRLHVAVSNISKATVNPYAGSEIPGWQELGLDANRVYNLLRPAEELEKAASTFNSIPLLSKHVPVSAADHHPDLVVGATGSSAQFVAPYLKNSLVVWSQLAIDGIESREQVELSCAYRYRPVMEPGEFEGQPYDGYMADIVGNHVALVEIGRAGPDVVVGDENPQPKRTIVMAGKYAALAALLKPLMAQDSKLTEKQLAQLVRAAQPIAADDPAVAHLKPLVAQDAKPEDLGRALVEGRVLAALKPHMAADAEVEAKQLADLIKVAQDAAKEDKAEDEDEEEEEGMEGEGASDEEDDEVKDKDDKKAMDAAISQAVKVTEAKFNAIRRAEREVKPLVGEVAAMDSADEIYRFALDAAGIDTKGIHPSAFPSLVKIAVGQKADNDGKRKPIAQDSAGHDTFTELFPDALIPSQGV